MNNSREDYREIEVNDHSPGPLKEIVWDMQWSFGDDSDINLSQSVNRKKNNPIRIKVVTTVNNSEFLEGGQKIEATLHESMITIYTPEGLLIIPGYFIDTIAIDGEENIFDKFSPIFVAKRHEIRGGTFGHLETATKEASSQVLILSELNEIGHVATILHEQGHLETLDENALAKYNEVAVELYRNDLKLIKSSADIPEKQLESMVDRWLYILNLESIANVNVFERVSNPRENSMWRKLFMIDNDGTFNKLKLELERHMNTYINAANGWYLKHLNDKQRTKLTAITSFWPA